MLLCSHSDKTRAQVCVVAYQQYRTYRGTANEPEMAATPTIAVNLSKMYMAEDLRSQICVLSNAEDSTT